MGKGKLVLQTPQVAFTYVLLSIIILILTVIHRSNNFTLCQHFDYYETGKL